MTIIVNATDVEVGDRIQVVVGDEFTVEQIESDEIIGFGSDPSRIRFIGRDLPHDSFQMAMSTNKTDAHITLIV